MHPPGSGHTYWPMHYLLPSSVLSIPFPLCSVLRIEPQVSRSFRVSVSILVTRVCTCMCICTRAHGGGSLSSPLNLLFLEQIKGPKSTRHQVPLPSLDTDSRRQPRLTAKGNYTWITAQNIPSSCRCSGSYLVLFFPSHHLSVCCFLHSDHGLHCHHLLS